MGHGDCQRRRTAKWHYGCGNGFESQIPVVHDPWSASTTPVFVDFLRQDVSITQKYLCYLTILHAKDQLSEIYIDFADQSTRGFRYETTTHSGRITSFSTFSVFLVVS